MQNIKDGQRQNPSFKDAWALYADTHCKGVRDPDRLSADVLRRFVYGAGTPSGRPPATPATGAQPR